VRPTTIAAISASPTSRVAALPATRPPRSTVKRSETSRISEIRCV